MRRWLCVSMGVVAVGCSTESSDTGFQDSGAEESSGASSLTADDDGSTGASASADGSDGTTAGSADTFIFDVGNGDSTGEDGTDTSPVGPGSCRQSEAYGAAGGYPHFTDPAYASFLDRQVIVMTSHTYQQNEFALRVIDISGDPPPPNMSYPAPIYTHATWHEAAFGGGIFGVTLDSFGNIYVAASTVYYGNQAPGKIYRIDGETAEITTFADLPNTGPAFGNINYDCHSETIRVVSHEDCRIWQLDMNANVVSTYHHGTGDVTIGAPADPGEPDGMFCPLTDRMWAVQSHAGRLYYSTWAEDSGRQTGESNEIWSVAYADDDGIPDPTTVRLEATIPGLNGAAYSNPVSDLSFAATGWMLVAERTMYGDTQTVAHQSTTYELQQMNGTWVVQGTTYVVGELPNSSAGGVDHDFEEGGYVWMSGDALDFNSPNVVYGVQGTPYGGGDITNSTLIDHDGEIMSQDKGALGDIEIPIPGDAEPPPPPPEG